MSVLADLIDGAAARLRAADIERPRAEARILLATALGIAREDLIAERAVLHPGALVRYENAILRRCAREPLAYIVGGREFWSLDFAVGPGVLIPRPESEILVEEALRHFPRPDERLAVLDLGTGSGCLLLSFLNERPNAEGLGTDTSLDALRWAAGNARGLGLANHAEWYHGWWTEGLNDTFDVILVNPPYVVHNDIAKLEPEVAQYEPVAALSGGTDGLDAYREIAAALAPCLAGRGRAFVELGAGQADAVNAIFTSAGLEHLHTAYDLAGIARCLILARA